MKSITLSLLFLSSVSGIPLEIKLNQGATIPETLKAIYLTDKNIQQQTYSNQFTCISAHNSRDGTVSFTNYCELGACKFNETVNTNETLEPVCNVFDEIQNLEVIQTDEEFYVLIEGCNFNGNRTWILTSSNEINFNIFNQSFEKIQLSKDQYDFPNSNPVLPRHSCLKLCTVPDSDPVNCTSNVYSSWLMTTIIVGCLFSVVLIIGSCRYLYLKV